MKRNFTVFLSLLLVFCMLVSSCGKKAAAPAEPDARPTRRPYGGGDTSYNPKTDADNRFTSENDCIIETDGGFYWSSAGCYYLLFYDDALEEVIPVCSRPECEHFPDNNASPQNRGCDAYLEAVRHPALYNGMIYYVDQYGPPNPNIDGSMGSCRLMRMNPDGTGKEFIKNLFTPGYESPQWIIIHRGNLYAFSPVTEIKNGEVTGKTTILTLPIEGDETTFKTIYSIDNNGWGCMRFIGDYCYFWIRYSEGYYYINFETGEEIDNQQDGGVAGRWNSKTEEVEILYQELLPKGEYYFEKAWFEPDGTIYVVGSRGLMRIKDGEVAVIQSFEDPEKEFSATNISDGIVIAHTVPEDFRDPYGSWDFWVCRFDGSTVFKGELPMDWYYESPEFDGLPGDPTWPGLSMVAGDETGLWIQFSASWHGTGHGDADADFLVRYDFTEDGGIRAKLYGSFDDVFDPND